MHTARMLYEHETSHLQAQRKVLEDFSLRILKKHLDSRFLASGTMRQKFLLFKSPNLWFSVTTALAN